MSSGFWVVIGPFLLGIIVGALIMWLMCRAYWKGPKR